MDNLSIRNFRDTVIAICNGSNLPVEVKRLVFSEINSLLKAVADKEIINEHNNKINDKEGVKEHEL